MDKILQTAAFSGSEVLRNLLSFLTRHSIERSGEVRKEYEIAVAVLGRPRGLIPRTDSAVRVHAGRLRAKLAEYYMSDGAEDPIVIEVPKGSYHISWRYRASEVPAPTRASDEMRPYPSSCPPHMVRARGSPSDSPRRPF